MRRIVPDRQRQQPSWIYILILIALVWANWPRIEALLYPPQRETPEINIESILLSDYPSPGDMAGCDKFRVTGVEDGSHIWLTNTRDEEFKAELLGLRYQKLSGPDWDEQAAWMLTYLLQDEQVWLWTLPGEQDIYNEDGDMLVWVWRYPDNLFINHELIRQGLALFDEQDSAQFTKWLKAAEDAAEKSERGFWYDE